MRVGSGRHSIAVGTRGSRLALAQTEWVIEGLRALAPELIWSSAPITTGGDRSPSLPRGEGVFVKEIQQALLEGEIDVAVHSLKDLPTDPVEGLLIAAIPQRADPREALVGAPLACLPAGARVGTGSPRRIAQLRRLRPDLDVVPLRGNVPTRVDRVRSGRLEAVMLAAAGLARLGFHADELLDPRIVLPAPGQGALAVEVRATDQDLAGCVALLDDPASRTAVTAERAILRELGGGCMLPVATFARIDEEGALVVEGAVTSTDGARQVRAEGRGERSQAREIACRVARRLTELGALEILEAPQASTGPRGP